MTSKAKIINLLREKGEEQLGHILQYTDYKPHLYKKMLKKKEVHDRIIRKKESTKGNNKLSSGDRSTDLDTNELPKDSSEKHIIQQNNKNKK